jgi:hypothetical protein
VFRSRLEGRAETADIPAEAARVLERFRACGARIPEPSAKIQANEDKE